MKKKELQDDCARVIKISGDALYELICEYFGDKLEAYMDAEPTQVMQYCGMDWENGSFIFCVANVGDEDAAPSDWGLPNDIDIEKLHRLLPETTTSLYQPNRYKEYTFEELREMLKESV